MPNIFLTNMACRFIFDDYFPLQIYDLAYDKAKEMLQKNRKVLEIIVEQLLNFENLTGEVNASTFICSS